MNKPRIVAVSGKAGAGKDTFADMLVKRLKEDGKTVYKIAYADLLKYIAIKYYSWDGAKDEKGRSLLQHIGTTVRSQNINYWVEEVERMVRCVFTDADYIVISDARYLNEINHWRFFNYPLLTINIVRPGLVSTLTPEQQAHPSENELNDFRFNVTITNTDLADLEAEADDLVISWKYKGD